MKMSFDVVASELQWEAANYREQYDSIMNTRNREMKELERDYNPTSPKYNERKERINNACDSAITKLRVQASERSAADLEELRRQEIERVQVVDESLLTKIRAIADIPMTTAELKAFSDKINAKSNYWASRAIADIAERNGIDASELGIETTLDTKLNVLDQMEQQLDKILKLYGTKDIDEKAYVRFLYLNDNVIENAKQVYGGKAGKLSDSQKADKAYINIKAQVTDIAKGISISNALRNAKEEVKNHLLCRLAEDNSISSMSAELSGHSKEIEEFKNGKAHEYRKAERAIENIRKTKDVAVIRQTAEEYSDNEFFSDMFIREQKQNEVLSGLLYGEPSKDSSVTE